MSKPLDLTNMEFGKLKVIRRVENNKHGKSRWHCVCDCGNDLVVIGSDLISGKTKSCGCLLYSHGQHGTRLYAIWVDMKNRCHNKNVKAYKNYGGRGIAVCSEWSNNFIAFHDWAISNGYNDNLTIDRINNDGDYEPNNCRWADCNIQSFNKRGKNLRKYGNNGISITPSGKYRATIALNGKNIHIGIFTTLKDAINARKSAELKYYKELSNKCVSL